MRYRINFKQNHQRVRFTDSMNAALVAALVDAGASSELVVGEGSAPWTFGMEAWSHAGEKRKIRSVVISSPDSRIAEAMARINVGKIAVQSCNGDRIDGSGARLEPLDDLAPGTDEVMISFISPFILPVRKTGREKTSFCEELPVDDLHSSLKAGLDRRAGRDLDLTIVVDRLSARIDGRRKHLIHYRRMKGGKSLILPGFVVPLTLRGNPDDIRFAYLAGFGAKTRAGNGCPAMMQ